VSAEAPYAATLVDAESGRAIAEVRESAPGLAARALARTELRHALPYKVSVGGIATLARGLSLLRPIVEVAGPDGAPLGELRQRLWSTGGGFDALDALGRRVATLRLAGGDAREGGAAELVSPDGKVLAWMAPARGPERRIGVDRALEGTRRALLLAALSALDRVLAG
jgi:hypothetical protein